MVKATPSWMTLIPMAQRRYGKDNRIENNIINFDQTARKMFKGYEFKNSKIIDLTREYSRLLDSGDLMQAEIFFNHTLINQKIKWKRRVGFLKRVSGIEILANDKDAADEALEDTFLDIMANGSDKFSYWRYPHAPYVPKEEIHYPLAKPNLCSIQAVSEPKRSQIKLISLLKYIEKDKWEDFNRLCDELGL